MQENFLHHIWQFQKLSAQKMHTVNGEMLIVSKVGVRNQNSGPDFFNAQIQIGEQLWAGNVEIHLRSSDWFVHHHEKDKNYDNVILHVVWEYDVPVFRKDNSEIPTLELIHYVSPVTLANYRKIYNKDQKWISCESEFHHVSDFVFDNWLDRLFFERLETKSLELNKLLQEANNDWEALLFKLLAKNFGLKVNAEAFLSVAQATDFSVIRKVRSNKDFLEALLLGQAGLLNAEIQDEYFNKLQLDYNYLKSKFSLDTQSILPVQFFRLRPSSFPTIRLSQLANLYHKNVNLFSLIIETHTLNNIYHLLGTGASTYWNTHYTFGKTTKHAVKHLTTVFKNLLIINVVVPIKFSYAQHLGKDASGEIIALISQIPAEKNAIISKYISLRKVSNTMLQSQALLQLKKEYCDKHQCLKCAIGNTLIGG